MAGHNAVLLDACLLSLLAQVDAPAFEVLVADNGRFDAAAVVTRRFPGAQVLATGRVLPGAARNPLVRVARGELLLFLDDDVTAPPDLLRTLGAVAALHPDVVVFGGPNDTPPRSTAFQVVQGAVLASIMGAGPVSRRYGARHAGYADERWFTLCNLAVRRVAMPAFADDLTCAEENAVLAELRRSGAPMRYEPELVVFHERRASKRDFARQMHKYGKGRGALMRRDVSTVRAAYLAPSALIAYAVLVVAVAVLGSLPALGPAPAGLYAALVLATAARVSLSLRRPLAFATAAGLIPLVHLCYGSGVVQGLVASPFRARAARAPALPLPAPHTAGQRPGS